METEHLVEHLDDFGTGGRLPKVSHQFVIVPLGGIVGIFVGTVRDQLFGNSRRIILLFAQPIERHADRRHEFILHRFAERERIERQGKFGEPIKVHHAEQSYLFGMIRLEEILELTNPQYGLPQFEPRQYRRPGHLVRYDVILIHHGISSDLMIRQQSAHGLFERHVDEGFGITPVESDGVEGATTGKVVLDFQRAVADSTGYRAQGKTRQMFGPFYRGLGGRDKGVFSGEFEGGFRGHLEGCRAGRERPPHLQLDAL
mmetsp:Transcript_34048/g.101741  ORF Transcript_34048/g.101741 Transcript_34048/m.101741 type:complete len:258 (-) Transcript_34048:1900-2673(-)